MGELNFFLGLQVLQKKDSIFLSQDKYVGDILKKFGYSDVRLANTLMDKENPWEKDRTGKDVDLHHYRSMIGSLMYLTASRPEIMFAVYACARIETMEEGTKILATVDGKLKTMSKSSIRRNLKINDEACISSLPDAKLYENLQLIGYNILPNQKFTFQKGQFSHQWKYLIHTIMQCLSPKSTGFNELSSNIATAVVYLATNRVYNFSKMIFDGMASQSSQHELQSPSLPPVPTESIPTVIPSDNPPLRKYSRRTRIAQSSVLPLVVDEPASPLGDNSQGKACPTNFGFEADQDRANIAKTSTFPSDSTPKVTSLVADEGSMQQSLDELTALCTSLQRQQSEMVSKTIWEEAAKRVSDDTEEMTTVLTSMDAASILTSGGVQVVPTAAEVATAT
nr:synaptobrevin, longin-like domain protein [Tanacetum cinerariifolium]